MEMEANTCEIKKKKYITTFGLTGMDRNIPKRVTPHESERVIMSRHGPNDTRIPIEIQFPQTNCERYLVQPRHVAGLNLFAVR